ncbi:MAG: transcription elongation factor GreA [Clostridia bacterium]|nr:transcription elongation factor GreA [Clostridia bacterium]
MQKQFKLTKERLEELKAELEHLKTVREKEVAELIKEARSFGDLSENSEYDEAKNEQGKLYSRIAELENIIPNAVIIDENASLDEGVTIGAKVEIEFIKGKRREEYSIVGSQEANPKLQRISDESPIGKALLGKHKGDTVTVDAPGGSFKCKIIEISR